MKYLVWHHSTSGGGYMKGKNAVDYHPKVVEATSPQDAVLKVKGLKTDRSQVWIAVPTSAAVAVTIMPRREYDFLVFIEEKAFEDHDDEEEEED